MPSDGTVIVPPEFIPVFLLPLIVFYCMLRNLKYSESEVFYTYILLQCVVCIVARLIYT